MNYFPIIFYFQYLKNNKFLILFYFLFLKKFFLIFIVFYLSIKFIKFKSNNMKKIFAFTINCAVKMRYDYI